MKETEFFIPSPVDQLPISCLVVEPEQPPRAVVLMAHGIMEHKERFLPVMRFFAEHGFACAMNDQRGNGKRAWPAVSPPPCAGAFCSV